MASKLQPASKWYNNLLLHSVHPKINIICICTLNSNIILLAIKIFWSYNYKQYTHKGEVID